jgi:hypothetical protein
MLSKEKELVNEEWVNRSDTYNIKIGGLGFTSDDTSGTKNGFYGKRHSEENKQKHSSFMKGNLTKERNGFYGKNHSDETKLKIINTCKKSASYGIYNPSKRKDVRNKIRDKLKGKPKSEDHKNKLSISKLNTYLLISKTNEIFELKKKEIKQFCLNNDLYYQAFRDWINKGPIYLSNKRKGKYTHNISNTNGWEIKIKEKSL